MRQRSRLWPGVKVLLQNSTKREFSDGKNHWRRVLDWQGGDVKKRFILFFPFVLERSHIPSYITSTSLCWMSLLQVFRLKAINEWECPGRWSSRKNLRPSFFSIFFFFFLVLFRGWGWDHMVIEREFTHDDRPTAGSHISRTKNNLSSKTPNVPHKTAIKCDISLGSRWRQSNTESEGERSKYWTSARWTQTTTDTTTNLYFKSFASDFNSIPIKLYSFLIHSLKLPRNPYHFQN